jgi:ABC-type antimicrobial peptide transport system permease subunit
MIRVALAGLLGRKLRTILTAIAIVLGVAMVTGTYILTDSIKGAFNGIFTEIYRGTDATITGKSAFDLSSDGNTTEPPFAQSLLGRVRALPDVQDAVGGVGGIANLVGPNGKVIAFGGAPHLGFSVDPTRPQFNTLTLKEGNWPAANELVVDKATAGKKDLKVGQTIGVEADGPVRRMRISGLVEFGGASSLGGATLAGFDLPTAQAIFDKPGKLDQIRAKAKAGVTPEQLTSEIQKILPAGTQVRTGEAQATEDAQDTTSFLSFLQDFLLAFGGIALFVGAFVIANSLSITIAQRTRELATLRTLGASRRQVLSSIVIEALVMGVLASVVGVLVGFALALGLFSLFDAVGFTLPNNGLVVATRTIVVAMLVGTLVTLVASLRPALRATRVPPIAAVREGATLPESRFARFRTIASALLAILGFAALAYGLFGSGLSTTQILVYMGVGTVLIFFGVALLSARIARPLASGVNPVGRWTVVVLLIVLWPFWTLPYWLLRYGAFTPAGAGRRVLALLGGLLLNPLLALIVLGMWVRSKVSAWQPEWPLEFPGVVPDQVTIGLARDNSQRNPQRTASTASALMIGLALVTLVAVLAAGITSSFRGAVNDLWTDGYAITAEDNFSPIPITAGNAAAQTPGVQAYANVRGGDAQVFGKTIQATALNPQAVGIFNLDWVAGSDTAISGLGAHGAIVDKDYAETHRLSLGSPLELLSPRGTTLPLQVRGIFDPPTGGSPFGRVTISDSAWDRLYDNPLNVYSFVQMKGGETDANRNALESRLKPFPNAKLQTKQEFIDNQIAGLNAILNVLYVLLALSVIVSLFGIVNTLVLSVFERTRELGMLRAIGMTRGQVRRMIRQESVITALIGGTIGIALGIVLGALLVARVDFIVFSLPIGQLIVFAIATIVLGVIAAIFPARRASRLNVLEALQYE